MTNKTGKISKETLIEMYEALKIANAIKCEDILFDDFGVSANSHATNVLIIQPSEYEYEFGAIGMGRIPDVIPKMRLLIDDPTLTGTFEEFRAGVVGAITLKTKKTKLEIRCKDPKTIKTKKNFHDKHIMSFALTAEAIKFMTQTVIAGSDQEIMFSLEDTKMILKILDGKSGDSLEHVITDDVNILDDTIGNVSFVYLFPRLSTVLSQYKEDTQVNISSRGVMNLKSDGFNLYVIAGTQ
jgi:hypothetical protein